MNLTEAQMSGLDWLEDVCELADAVHSAQWLSRQGIDQPTAEHACLVWRNREQLRRSILNNEDPITALHRGMN